MDGYNREFDCDASQARFADVRALREQRRSAHWEEDEEEPLARERPKGSFGRVMLVQAIVCAVLLGGVFFCQKSLPNTWRQLSESYTRVMQTDMSAKEVWAAAKAVFARLREEVYVLAPYDEAPDSAGDRTTAAYRPGADVTDAGWGAGGLDVSLAYASKSCTATPLLTTAPPVRPLDAGLLTSAFGYRKHPISGEEGVHTGLDIAAPTGEPIHAAFYGTVEETGEGKDFGKYVILQHAGGLQTVYAHCSEVYAEKGMVLRAGDVVGLVGSTGNSTGPHLHFEVRLNGLRCDPAPLFGANMYAPKQAEG